MKDVLRLSVLLLAFFISIGWVHGQNPNQKIDFDNPDVVYFESLILEKLNAYRRYSGLKSLVQDSILQLAAKNQSKYNYKTRQIGSAQSKKSMATPFLRVNRLGGSHAVVKESNTLIEIGEKTKIKGIRGRQIINTYNDAADAIISEWSNSKYDNEHLMNDELYRAGISLLLSPQDKLIFCTAVMAAEPYLKTEGVSYSKNSFKIAPYSSENCRFFERTYGYLPELLSSSLSEDEGNIILEYHDLNLIKSLLESSRDGFAVDLVSKDQYNCKSGNRDHPSKVERGLLLKPLKKGKLLKKNLLKEENQFKVILGAFPSQFNKQDVEMNLLVIKDKCNCATILPNNIDSRNLRLLDVDFVIDTLSISEDADSLSRQLNFTIPFEKNKAAYQVEDIKPILDSIQLNRYDIKKINITAYSSIEGNKESNEVLQQKRAESILAAIKEYQLQEVETSITSLENFDGFKSAIKASLHADKFESLNDEELRNLVNSDTLGFDLEPFLSGQRKAEVQIIVESIYIDSLTPDVLPRKLQKAISENDYIAARGIQTLEYKNVLKNKLDKKVLFPDFVPFVKENMPFMNNYLAFKFKFYEGNNPDSLFESLKMDLNRFHAIEPENAHLNYNKQLVELYYWSVNIHYLMIDEEANINQPKELYQSIKRLYNTKIDNYKVNQLMLNYYLIAADFYYETEDYKMREKSLKAVKKLVINSKLNMEQTYLMAGYFMFQIQMDWAVEIMLPFIKSNNYDEEFLFRLLSIAIYTENRVSAKKYLDLLEKAELKNNKRFCALFGSPNMSFQLLGSKEIKSLYCDKCK